MTNKIRITLKSGKEQSIKRRHPWIFSGAIKKIEGDPVEGSLAEVISNNGEFLAIGHYQVGSIAVRIFSFENIIPDFNFWLSKIQSAYYLRERLGLTNSETTNVYRLINGEGDEMPGVIIDYYNGVTVTQFHSIGMYQIRNLLTDVLIHIYGEKLKAVYDKSSGTIPFKSGIENKDEYLYSSASPRMVKENGIQFRINYEEGQKTGFFIDQRENRNLLKEYSANRNVLNMFCYTGGFSVYALRGGATQVHSVDSSETAMKITNENIELNFPGSDKHKVFTEDAFQFLGKMNPVYDLIILDPPAFAKHQNVLDNALKGYKRLNQIAIEKICKGGIIFTFSCSQVVSKENFRKSVFAAAANTGRKVKILHQLSQPADHPISIYHPEGEYLKGLVLYIE